MAMVLELILAEHFVGRERGMDMKLATIGGNKIIADNADNSYSRCDSNNKNNAIDTNDNNSTNTTN
jgi:hypothetical protein